MFNFSTLVLVVCLSAVAYGAATHKEVEGYDYLGRSVAKNGIQAKDYYLSHIRGSHYEGEAHCRNTFGGQLAIVLTSNQDIDLRQWTALPGNGIDCAHVGGVKTGNNFSWQSGNILIPFGYTNWQAGEPRASGGECVCVHGLGPQFGWHTCPCQTGTAYQFICEL